MTWRIPSIDRCQFGKRHLMVCAIHCVMRTWLPVYSASDRCFCVRFVLVSGRLLRDSLVFLVSHRLMLNFNSSNSNYLVCVILCSCAPLRHSSARLLISWGVWVWRGTNSRYSYIRFTCLPVSSNSPFPKPITTWGTTFNIWIRFYFVREELWRFRTCNFWKFLGSQQHPRFVFLYSYFQWLFFRSIANSQRSHLKMSVDWREWTNQISQLYLTTTVERWKHLT